MNIIIMVMSSDSQFFPFVLLNNLLNTSIPQLIQIIYLQADKLSNDGDGLVDGAVIAAARTLPTWSDGDVPPVPSLERKAVKELQEECQQMLGKYTTTAREDQKILGIYQITLSIHKLLVPWIAAEIEI